VLLLPPDRLDLEEGETSKLKLNLYYFDQEQGAIRVEAGAKPGGLSIESVTAPSIRDAIEIPVSAKPVLANNSEKEPSELILIARDAASGRILSESPPVSVRISTRSSPGSVSERNQLK
jgi:hypothetical protein